MQHSADRTTLEQAGDLALLVFIKNTELSPIPHLLLDRWLYWIRFSIAQQMLPEGIQRVSTQRYMDPFSDQGREEKQNRGKKNPQPNKKPQPRLYLLISIPCQKDREVHQRTGILQ